MTCFEWRNIISDYLEGSLPKEIREATEKHLESCHRCNQQVAHFRILIEKIKTLSIAPVSEPVKRFYKNPKSASKSASKASHTPKKQSGNLQFPNQTEKKSRWGHLHWAIRYGLEGLGITTVVLLIVFAIPRLRTFYETHIHNNLHALNLKERLFSASKTAPVRELDRESATALTSQEDAPTVTPEALLEPLSNPLQSRSKTPKVQVGSSEIWRFYIKTDSLDEMRPKIIETLTELDLGDSGEKRNLPFEGTEAPGGIQFNLLVPRNLVLELKGRFRTIANSTGSAQEDIRNTFTWYKNKSQKRLPKDQTRVIIWLSQI